MSVVAVDLAAKYSAAVHIEPNGAVPDQWDSVEFAEDEFVYLCVAQYTWNFADQLVVEDLPHGLDYRGLVKRVCQLQGRITERLHSAQRDHQRELLFVAPQTWRRHYPPLRQLGLGMGAVVPVAAELGYEPPELAHLRGPRGGAAVVQKLRTDYCAAYLIGRWAIDTHAEYGTFDVPGTARYGQPAIRKH